MVDGRRCRANCLTDSEKQKSLRLDSVANTQHAKLLRRPIHHLPLTINEQNPPLPQRVYFFTDDAAAADDAPDADDACASHDASDADAAAAAVDAAAG